MKTGFWTASFCNGAFLFSLVASLKPRCDFTNSLRRVKFTGGMEVYAAFKAIGVHIMGRDSN